MKKSFHISTTKTLKAFKIIHSNMWSPTLVDSFNSCKYFVAFIDDFLRTTLLYLLKTMNEMFPIFKEFSRMISNQYNSKSNIFL